MKKLSKILSLLLIVAMVATMISVPASAAFALNEYFTTPYGQVHCEIMYQNMTPLDPDPIIGFSAGTSINSNLTMAWTYTALQVQTQAGKVLLNDANYAYNSNVSSAGGQLLDSLNPSVGFSTHSVLYTTSYAKYYTVRF